MSLSSNDNTAPPLTPNIESEAQGQAAILLVESLIHGLVEKSVLSATDAVSIIETAADVSREMALATAEAAPRIRSSITILEAMSRSLGRDL